MLPVLVLIGALLLGPLGVIASGEVEVGRAWYLGSRDSSGQAPSPAAEPRAVVQVYAARTVGWRGAFGVHTWIATKRAGDDAYLVHHVVGWRVFRGAGAVVSQTGTPDARWFGAWPALLVDHRGEAAEAMIDRIEAAVAAYPWPAEYRAWPGPNSNTFTAFVARRVPELRLDLPPHALGKDWLEPGRVVAPTPSGTGWQLSLAGVLGVAVAAEEGLELNVLGLSFGVDANDLSLRLPGFGRVGMASPPAGAAASAATATDRAAASDPPAATAAR
ncbi:MAG TPA: DUF3750 domain-containing protein [Burkholderiaceae bacterium]|nr:DUF3750 domain-containing protein [Burkholderiaceae bacterium]